MKFNLKSMSIIIGISALIALGLWRPWENAERETPQIDLEEAERPNTPIEQFKQCGYAEVVATLSCSEEFCMYLEAEDGERVSSSSYTLRFVKETKEGCMFQVDNIWARTKSILCDNASWYNENVIVETNVDAADIVSGPTIQGWSNADNSARCKYRITMVIRKP